MKGMLTGFCLAIGCTEPLAASAQEVMLMPVPVRAVYPGQQLDDVQFTMKLFTVPESSRKSYAFEKAQFQGKQAVKTLIAGKPVVLQSIRVTERVKKGQPTKAIYSLGTIEIQGVLVPLTGGSVGDLIETRNPESGGIVAATVMENGSLLVTEK